MINVGHNMSEYNKVCLVNSGGGLGNQLFQICTLYAFALQIGKTPVLLADYNETYRKRFTDYIDSIFQSFSTSVSYIEVQDMFSKRIQPIHYKESNFWYNTIPTNANLIQGYFQSYKYFKESLPQLRQLFHYNTTSIREKLIDKWSITNPYDSCMCHVRRGDYVGQFSDIYEYNGEEYYDSALTMLLSKQTNVQTLFVFTDDFKCVKNWNVWKKFTLKIIFVEEPEALETFIAMLQCGNFIVTNSSLSLAASLLSQYQNGVKMASSKWFKPASHVQAKLEDLYPEDYIII